MSLTPKQIAANMRSAQNFARYRANVPASGSLDYGQRIAYMKELAKIVAAYPDRFSPLSVTAADDVLATDYSPLSSDTALDKLKVFADEFAAQGVRINEGLNPFSAGNLAGTASTLKTAAILTGVAVVLWFAAPVLIPAITSRSRP